MEHSTKERFFEATCARRTAVVAAVLLGVLVTLPLNLAGASAGGSGQGLENTSSATWSVVATQSTSMPPPVGPLSLTFGTNATQYFSVVNSGTVDLTALTYTVTLSGSGGKPRVTLVACSVPWNQSSGTCGGTATPVATWAGGPRPPVGMCPRAPRSIPPRRRALREALSRWLQNL